MSINFIKPARLKPGDKVAIISPSSGCAYLYPAVYAWGLERLRTIFKLEPVEFPTTRKSPEYLSQNPQARAEDINNAFKNPEIKAIIATTGGNDQIRILKYLDNEAIKNNPKIFMGYSDCTNLHLYLWNLGIISYYGGSIISQFAMQGSMHEYTVDAIRKALFEDTIGPVFPSQFYTDYDLDWSDESLLTHNRPVEPNIGWEWHNWNNQVIQGRLWGGCLEILDLHLAVDRYLPQLNQLENSILFIETSEELPTSGFVYRFVAALAEKNMLDKFSALLVGRPKAQFLHMLPPEGKEQFIKNQEQGIKKALEDYGSLLPVVFNMDFGHTDPQLILPSGGSITIDSRNRQITLG